MDTSVLIKAVEDLRQLYQGLLLEPEVWKRDGHRRDPYRVLIVMGLSAGGVADAQLTSPCTQLFTLCSDPGELVAVWKNQPDKIISITKQLNWWGRKAKFVEAAVTLVEGHGGSIPRDRTLIKRKWIGDKVVECVLGYGYGMPAVPVDGHVCRVVFQVCGLQFEYPPANYDAYVRDNIKKSVDPMVWMEIHELLRLHGQAICAKSPDCSLCDVGTCRSRKVDYSGGRQSAKARATKIVESWEVWRQLLLKPADTR